MGNISVRKVDDRVLQELKLRATRRGISMEEEIRRTLKESVHAPLRLGDLALALFGPENGVDLELPPRETHEPITFDE